MKTTILILSLLVIAGVAWLVLNRKKETTPLKKSEDIQTPEEPTPPENPSN